MGNVLEQFGLKKGPLTTPPIVGDPQAVDPNAGEIVMAPPVDAWRPKKVSFLAALGDAYLNSQGMPGGFIRGRQQRNIKEAMRDFATDPIAAIRRLNMIPGQHDEAWKMYNEYTDNERQQGTLDRQNKLFDLQLRKFVHGQVAGMMATASKENWGKLRDMSLRVGEENGVDLAGLIPEQYDPDSVAFIQNGQIKPKDFKRLQQHDRSQNWREYYQGQRLEDFDTAEQGRNSRTQITEQGKNYRHETPRGANPKSEPRYVKTPKGYMELSPSGNLGRIVKDGKVQTWKKVRSGQWELVKEEAEKEEAE